MPRRPASADPAGRDRIAGLDDRVRDLPDLRRHLSGAQSRLLALPSRDSPCDSECTVRPAPAGAGVPVACSLSADDHAERLANWRSALSGTAPQQLDDGSVRLDVPLGRVAEVAALVAVEVACCPFFRFTLTVDRDGARLDAAAPAEARPLLDALLSPTAAASARSE